MSKAYTLIFAVEIFKELNVVSPEMINFWYDAFKNGNYPENTGP